VDQKGPPGQIHHIQQASLRPQSAATTSKQLWDAIVRKYEQNRNTATIASTMQEIFTKNWESGNLEQHIAWYRSTNQLLLARFDPGIALAATTGAAVQEHVLVVALSNSIPNTAEWGAVKANIHATSLFRFEETASRLMGEWQRLQMEPKDSRVSSAAAAHFSVGLPSADDRNDERPVCSHCDKPGHKADKCWTLHPDLAPGFV
jgi:hypothetical protein